MLPKGGNALYCSRVGSEIVGAPSWFRRPQLRQACSPIKGLGAQRRASLSLWARLLISVVLSMVVLNMPCISNTDITSKTVANNIIMARTVRMLRATTIEIPKIRFRTGTGRSRGGSESWASLLAIERIRDSTLVSEAKLYV